MKTIMKVFVGKPGDSRKKWFFDLFPNTDTLALDTLPNAEQIYPREAYGQTDTDIIAIYTPVTERMQIVLSDIIEVDDPLSPENQPVTDVTMDIVGRVFDSIERFKKAYPVAAGTFNRTEYREDGSTYQVELPKTFSRGWNGIE